MLEMEKQIPDLKIPDFLIFSLFFLIACPNSATVTSVRDFFNPDTQSELINSP